MKIHTVLDDSAARFPLTIRSADAVWDRGAEIRSAPGVQLVNLTAQHVLNTGTTLFDELSYYFEEGHPSESDPFGLAQCFAQRSQLEDLWRDVRDAEARLTAFNQVEALFPASFQRDLHFTLALTTVGIPAFGYVRAFRDSEGDEYHGMVINLAQARAHLESLTGQFSLSLLIDSIRYGFFNHEGFLLAYTEYCHSIGRMADWMADRLKNALLSRGIAWYLSYRHDLPFYDSVLGLDAARLGEHVEHCNVLIAEAGRKRALDEVPDDWLQSRESRLPGETCLDVVGYHAARAIAAEHGEAGLRESIERGPDHFIGLYNALGMHRLRIQPEG